MDTRGLEILEEQHAHAVLIRLLETPGILRSELYDSIISRGASKSTAIKRVNELIEAGLIRVEQSKTHKAGQYLFLTDQGRKIAELAVRMKGIIDGDPEAGDDTDDFVVSSSQQGDKMNG